MKTIKFYTLGCRVNQYDTQIIREQFINAGFRELEDGEPANFCVINTCTVTHKADSESFNLIRKALRENPFTKIIVTGCLTELDEDKINEISGINLIVKNKDKENIIKLLPYQNRPNGQTNEGISYFKAHTRAFLKVQDGCNNFCSYCKVPLVRGRSRSKSLIRIVDEASRLIKNGFKEIVLTGICLGTYGRDLDQNVTLVNVLEELEKLKECLRIRLSSIELTDVSDELIDKMAKSEKLCPHLHIPLQSADDGVLKKMHRNYCREDYANLIKKIRKIIPKVAITTDVLVGFPGETEENFQNTINLIKDILPLKVHIFPYSKREGTFAANNFRDEIKTSVVKERIAQLKRISDECSRIFRKQFLNKDMIVLIEERKKENPCLWQGYTENYIRVMVCSEQNLKNKPISLKIKKILSDYATGILP
jgi:threonylcarbamoyladenosine tRNA methylthiotransferase MtaB